nr:hypothetical protein NG677_03930 [Methylobacterium sp. OTU13CASTA1]
MTALGFFIAGLGLILFARMAFVPANLLARFKVPDDSDGPGAQSHMVVLRDHKTGREYLAVVGIWGFAAITPRLPGAQHDHTPG